MGRGRGTLEAGKTGVGAIAQENRQQQEADCLPGFSHPRETAQLFGHDRAERALLNAIRSQRLHHAWLIKGADGIGKATLAYRIARFMLSSTTGERPEADGLSVPETDAAVARITSLSHPNLLVLRRPWQQDRGRLAQNITVGEVRRLRSFLGNTAGSDGWRIVIVDRAEDMNANAANALLKALEEPPARCLFLLVSAAPGRLPVTIRSRCRQLKLDPLEFAPLQHAVRHALEGAGISAPADETLGRSLALAEGSVGRALQLLNADGLALYDKLYEALASLPNPDYGALHTLADRAAAAGDQERFDLTMDLLEGMIARLIRHSAIGRGAIGEEGPLANALIGSRGLAPWAELWETLRRAKAETLALNLDRKSFILGTFFKLEETARLEMAPAS